MRHINFYQAVYRIVRAIPSGQVVSYGAIATWLGAPRAARAVGYALKAEACGSTPWHRVVNHRGGISEGGAPWRPDEQRRRLESEKLRFTADGLLDLNAVGFRPSSAQMRRWRALGEQVRLTRLR